MESAEFGRFGEALFAPWGVRARPLAERARQRRNRALARGLFFSEATKKRISHHQKPQGKKAAQQAEQSLFRWCLKEP